MSGDNGPGENLNQLEVWIMRLGLGIVAATLVGGLIYQFGRR